MVWALLCASTVLAAGLTTAPAVGAEPPGRLVGAVPAVATPEVRDGTVLAFVQIGDTMVAGGDFTTIAPRGGSPLAQRGVFAFDATTGALRDGFRPVLDGAVEALLPGPLPNTVYAAGSFKTVNGANRKSLAVLDVTTGQVVTSFAQQFMNGIVRDIEVRGDRLLLGGTFTTVNGQPRGGLASVSAAGGVLDGFLAVNLTEHHNWNGTGANAAIGAMATALSPDGSRLVVIGNFKRADGLDHDQAVAINLTGPTAVVDTSWHTNRYDDRCAANAFDSWVRDVQYSPDGSYFVIVTTGAPFLGTLCDTTARWNTSASGTSLQPAWVDYTGGDTLLSVEIADGVIYTGGHQRWHNNPQGRDNARTGAVPRPGIAALSPENGTPFSWNPGRNPRGDGASVVYASATGLWVGSDTEWIGDFDYFRPRIAFFPFSQGVDLPTTSAWSLPANVYQAGPLSGATTSMVRRYWTGSAVEQTATVGGGVDWTNVRGAFAVDGTLFHGWSDGKFYRRPFDGVTAGAATLVDPYNDPYWSNVDTGSGQTFRGVVPNLFGTEMTTVTGMYYRSGRIYYTVSGQSALWSRPFNTESGIIGGERTQLAGISMPADLRGMFVAGDTLYYARSDGTLRAAPMSGVTPNLGAATFVGGPPFDGINWSARALLVGPGPDPSPNQLPTASFTSSCTLLECSLDGSSSSDADGTITGYGWDFGDGTTGSGATTTHTFPFTGTYQVTLEVTDNEGGTGTVSHDVSVDDGQTAVTFRDGASAALTTASPSVTVPASVQSGDGLLLFVSVNKAATVTATTPAGWAAVGQRESGTMTTRLYQRVATGADAGSVVGTTLSELSKVDLQVLAYDGTSGTAPVAQFASAADTVAGSSHTTPTLTATADPSWVVSYWADKSSVVTGWTPPAGQTQRGLSLGTGTGYITSLATDAGAPVPSGSTVGGLTATTTGGAGSKATDVDAGARAGVGVGGSLTGTSPGSLASCPWW